MHHALYIAGGFTISEPGQDGSRLGIVFVGILVVESDSDRVMSIEQRRYSTEQFPILGFQLAVFFQDLFAGSGHGNDDKTYSFRSTSEIEMLVRRAKPA